ncbi:kievitone hydratase [Fusarium oxysporum f. sp. phaseoli]
MRLVSAFTACLVLFSTIEAKIGRRRFQFKPENTETIQSGALPILYDLSKSQPNSVGGSWWSSSYITGTNGEQYVVLSHYLDHPAFTYFRASSLNIGTKEYYQYVLIGNGTANITDLNVGAGDNGIISESSDNLSKIRTYSNHENVTFDFTYEATTSALVNAGSGTWQFGEATSSEWALPNCKTEGWIISGARSGKKVTIDPTKSFTWYDRQWGNTGASPSTWTWFQLHIPTTDYKLSAWIFDDPVSGETKRFATIRGAGDQVQFLPIESKPLYKRSYKSSTGHVTYPLDWEVEINGFGAFKLSSVAEDQELVGEEAIQTAYEGFLTLKGEIHGKSVEGFGLVEIVYSTWDL